MKTALSISPGACCNSKSPDNTRSSPDPYGGLATISKNELVVSPISKWDLGQKRCWPPELYQAYCAKHFLQECLVHFSLESENIELEAAKLPEKATKLNARKSKQTVTVAAPTRVQPRRRAKEAAKVAEDTAKKTQDERLDQDLEENKTAAANLQRKRSGMQLQLPWAEFRTHLEGLIAEATGTAQAHREGGTSPLSDGPFAESATDCRYCQDRQVEPSEDGLPPPRTAPVAPMLSIQPDEIVAEQTRKFGGIEFAVEIYGNEAKIVLLGMETTAGLFPKTAEDKEEDDADSLPTPTSIHDKEREEDQEFEEVAPMPRKRAKSGTTAKASSKAQEKASGKQSKRRKITKT